MPLRSCAIFQLIMSRHREELHGAPESEGP